MGGADTTAVIVVLVTKMVESPARWTKLIVEHVFASTRILWGFKRFLIAMMEFSISFYFTFHGSYIMIIQCACFFSTKIYRKFSINANQVPFMCWIRTHGLLNKLLTL